MKVKQISIADYMHAQHRKEELAKRTAKLDIKHYNDNYYAISYWINNCMENNVPKRHQIK